MTAPDWLFATIRDLGKQVRAERERADAAEDALRVAQLAQESILGPKVGTGKGWTGLGAEKCVQTTTADSAAMNAAAAANASEGTK